MIDPQLKRALRIVAAYHEIDMGEYMERAIREKMQRDKILDSIKEVVSK